MEQVISPRERTAFDFPPVLPISYTHGLVEISFYQVRAADTLYLLVGLVRDVLADEKSSPRRRGWCKAPRAQCKLVTLVWNFMPIHGLDHL